MYYQMFLDLENATPVEKTLLMALERIEELEKEVDNLKKESIIRSISSLDSRADIWFDVFLFLLGIDIETRIRITQNKRFLYLPQFPENIPERALALHKIQGTSTPVWKLSNQDFDEYNLFKNYSYGDNIYSVLQNMTLKELEDYWEYRLTRLKWIGVQH